MEIYMKIKHKPLAVVLALIIALLSAVPAGAGAVKETPYQTLEKALKATHQVGVFKIKGSEKAEMTETADGKNVTVSSYEYKVTGYDAGGYETYLSFENTNEKKTTEFLLIPEAVCINDAGPGGKWQKKDVTAMLPKFVSLGTMDFFFMLEILNSGKLAMYEKYLSLGEDTKTAGAYISLINIEISRQQYIKLAEELTGDVSALLGPAADSFSELQLALIKSFAQAMLKSLDAEMSITFYVNKETSRIIRAESKIEMANPYGSRKKDASPRIKSASVLSFFDFCRDIERVKP
jgi:uncharacterized protein YxeA